MRVDDVAALRAAVREADDRVRVHVDLASLHRNVAEERSELALLFHRNRLHAAFLRSKPAGAIANFKFRISESSQSFFAG